MILSTSYKLYIAVQRRQYRPHIRRFAKRYRCIEYKRYRYRYYETIFDDIIISEVSIVYNMNLVCVLDMTIKYYGDLPCVVIRDNEIGLMNASGYLICYIMHHSIIYCQHTTTCVRVVPIITFKKQLNLIKSRYQNDTVNYV